MNKEELKRAVKDSCSDSANCDCVDAVFNVITEKLKSGEEVKITGFGTFSVANRAARTGRNPQTGETIQIAASNSPKFKAGKGLKEAVN